MKKFLIAVSLLAATLTVGAAKKVHTLGDSTMAPYDEQATVTRGWGMYFGQFLTNGWTSINYARGGRDSRGGYDELWQTAKKQVAEGDYVIIQFAHNDEKNGGMDGYQLRDYYLSIGDQTAAAAVDLRGSIPSTTYKENLKKIAEEVQALGAYPVFVGAVCRSYFSGGKIKRNGRHDLGDSYSILTANGPTTGNKLPASDHTMDYTYQMQQLASEMNLPFVDLTQATAELYESYGDTKCHDLLFDGQGSTHFNTTGALLVARTCAQLMKQQGILSDNIEIPSDLSVTPLDGDFGQAYVGQTLQKEYTLSGFGLQPENGSVFISATDGISLSFNGQDWTNMMSIDYQASTLIQTFYAQVTLAGNGVTEGKIVISSGNKTIEIPVTATAVVLEGGTEVEAYWRLEKDDTYTLTGPATVIPESWTGMYVQRYSNPNANTTWPDWTGFDATRKTQRNLLTGDAWPADEIDDNPDRYIEWGIKPAAGTTLNIDEISLFVCGCGGNGMCSHIYYSTDGFETRTTIFEMKKMPANNMQYVKAQPVISLSEGQELLVRVYPWYNGAATGKTICLSDLRIHGVAQEAFQSETIDHQPTTVSFPFDKGTEGQTATFTDADWFKNSYVDHGADLVLKDASNGQTRFQPEVSNDGTAHDGNAINFYFTPKDGLTFTPTKVSFKTTRYGTDGGKVDVSWVNSDASTISLATAISPARNNASPHVTEFSKEVSSAPASDGLCGLRLNLYGLGNTKQVGFADIVIEGVVNGTTQDVKQCRLFDAIVSASGSVPDGFSGGVYQTVQAAIDAAPAGRAKPWLIFVKNGQYKEHVNIPANKPYLHLIGQTRDNTVILNDALSGGDTSVGTDLGATVTVKSGNVFFENLTLENEWGHTKQAGPQALALNTMGDRIALNGVRLLSYQDTWITTSTSNYRHYIKNSVIEGAVDFIYNSGNVYMDGDTLEINRPSGGFIVAPSHGADVKWGYVFMNNVIRPYPGMNVTDVWLGRPWHNQPKTVFINTQTFVNIPAAGWYETMGGLPSLWADYNTTDAQGNPVDLSQRRDTYYYTDSNGQRVYGTAKNHLTDEEAAQYTVKNVMSGSDNWQPDLMCEACEAPRVQAAANGIAWKAVPYAICYVVTRGQEVVGFTTATEYATAEDAGSFKVQAVNEFGGLSAYGSIATSLSIANQPAGDTASEAYYTLDGKRLAEPRRGLVIVRQGDGSVRKILR